MVDTNAGKRYYENPLFRPMLCQREAVEIKALFPDITPQVRNATVFGPTMIKQDGGTSGDPASIVDGTADGQLLFWDESSSKSWVYTEVTEIWWDDTNKSLGIAADSSTYTSESYLVIADNTLDTTTTFYGIYNIVIKTDGVTDAADNLTGLFISISMADSDSTIGDIRAARFHATLSANGCVATTNITGVTSFISIGDNVTTDTLCYEGTLDFGTSSTVGNDTFGCKIKYIFNEPSTLTISGDMYGYYVNMDLGATVTVTGNCYGLYITQDYDGTVTGSTYGIYIDENTGQDYGIYQSGIGANFFGGNTTCNKSLIANEGGGDNDCRIEGDTDTNLFYTDAGNDRVGIGTNTPGVKFDVNGAATVQAQLIVNEGGTDVDSRIESNNDANMVYVDAGNDMLGVRTAAPESSLDVNGSFGTNVVSIAVGDSPYTALATDHTILVDNSGGNVTINLPAAATCKGRIYIIKLVTGGFPRTLTVDGNGAETIDGAATYSNFLNQYQAATIQSDGSNWHCIGVFP